mgnify:CR=1 FL=1
MFDSSFTAVLYSSVVLCLSAIVSYISLFLLILLIVCLLLSSFYSLAYYESSSLNNESEETALNESFDDSLDSS